MKNNFLHYIKIRLLYVGIPRSGFSQWFYDYRAKTVSENILVAIESKDTA